MEDSILSLSQLYQKPWFAKLPITQKELLSQSFYLLDDVHFFQKTFFDYSFLVMPAAKAYEGYLKDKFLKLNLISKKRWEGHRFRIGKALNPELAKQDPDGFERLYDDLERIYGNQTAQCSWQTWKLCRNRVFHYFNKEKQAISLTEAKQRLQMIIDSIDQLENNS